MLYWLWWSSKPGTPVTGAQIRITQDVRLTPTQGESNIRVTQDARLVPMQGESQIRITQAARLTVLDVYPVNFKITQDVRLVVLENWQVTTRFPALTVAI